MTAASSRQYGSDVARSRRPRQTLLPHQQTRIDRRRAVGADHRDRTSHPHRHRRALPSGPPRPAADRGRARRPRPRRRPPHQPRRRPQFLVTPRGLNVRVSVARSVRRRMCEQASIDMEFASNLPPRSSRGRPSHLHNQRSWAAEWRDRSAPRPSAALRALRVKNPSPTASRSCLNGIPTTVDPATRSICRPARLTVTAQPASLPILPPFLTRRKQEGRGGPRSVAVRQQHSRDPCQRKQVPHRRISRLRATPRPATTVRTPPRPGARFASSSAKSKIADQQQSNRIRNSVSLQRAALCAKQVFSAADERR